MGELLEREAELAALGAALGSARGGRGAAVVVGGPAGIGKSVLLRAATRDAGAPVLSATAGAHETDIPFEVMRSLFARRVGSAPPAERERLLAGPARAAAPLLGFGAPGESSEPAFALHGLLWLTQELAAAEPLVIVIDDAQWADEPSLRFLSYLARRIDDVPVALLLGVRTGVAGAASQALLDEIVHACATRSVELQPPSDEAAGGRAGDAPSELVAAARGNPLLIVRGVAGAEGLERAVDRRIAEIGPDARAVARAVALLGGAAEVPSVAEITGLAGPEVVRLLEALALAGVVETGSPLRIVHPLIADAVLAGLGLSERAAAHGRAATALRRLGADAERVASHLLAVPPAADPGVVDTLREAAAGAARAGAPAAAAQFLERALREPPTAAERPHVQYELGTVMTRIGRGAGIDHLMSAFETLDDTRRRVDVARQLSQLAWFVGDERAREHADRIVDSLPAELEPEQWFLRAGQLFNNVVSGVAIDPADLAAVREHASVESLFGRFARSVLAVHGALTGAAATSVERDALDALGTVEGYQHALEAGFPLFWAFAALDQLGLCTPELAGRLDLAKRSASRRGTVLGLAAAHVMAAEIAVARGRAEDALEEARSAIALCEGTALRVIDGRARVAGARAHLLCGDSATAWEWLEAIAGQGVPEGLGALSVALARGQVQIVRGEPAAARESLDRVGRDGLRLGYSTANDLDWRSPLAGALLSLGETEPARDIADAGLAAARASGGPRPLARALRTVALAGAVERRATGLSEALDALDGFDLPLDRAVTLLELGAHLRRRGERRVARDHLAEALDVADRLGASALAARAREELVASGARPRRTRRWGLDALTASELRVARLAGEGMTNREIAAELFVTPKTVEVHLSRCYRKLDVAGREELAGALQT